MAKEDKKKKERELTTPEESEGKLKASTASTEYGLETQTNDVKEEQENELVPASAVSPSQSVAQQELKAALLNTIIERLA